MSVDISNKRKYRWESDMAEGKFYAETDVEAKVHAFTKPNALRLFRIEDGEGHEELIPVEFTPPPPTPDKPIKYQKFKEKPGKFRPRRQR